MGHKGSRVDAELVAVYLLADPEWTPSQTHPELFNELNFIPVELKSMAARCKTAADAQRIINHPNSNQSIKAQLIHLEG